MLGKSLTLRSSRNVPARVLKEARARQQDSRWLSTAGVVKKYRGKYVAVKNKRIVASSSTMRGLYRKLDRSQAGMVLIAKVERPALLVYG